MPELVAPCTALWVLLQLCRHRQLPGAEPSLTGIEATIHQIEIFVGVYRCCTFTGSVIAFSKLRHHQQQTSLASASLAQSGHD